MISVTVAAHGLRNRRTIGTHFKAYDSGRLLIEEGSELEDVIKINNNNFDRKKKNGFLFNFYNYIYSFLSKICSCLWTFFNAYIPLWKLFKTINYEEILICPEKYIVKNKNHPPMENTFILRKIFSYMDVNDLLKMAKVSKKWRRVIKIYSEQFDHFHFDQIKINLDEGQIILFSLDAQRDPKRFTIQSLRELESNMKHIKVNSLFIRGMIKSESKIIMKLLNCLSLGPTQFYCLYCDFCPESIFELKKYISINQKYINDIGFEECSSNELFDDEIFIPTVPNLVNLRIINTSSHINLAVTDKLLFEIIEYCELTKSFTLQFLMINRPRFTVQAFIGIMEVWNKYCKNDLIITLQNATFTINDLLGQCHATTDLKIISKKFIESNNYYFHINIVKL
ncbi:F-box domain-containing protein [Strongyloides ratti]|uniref:F-box domain-containing protein n=1 Tax=Strongyloides ratti TaxID=34506 RepID=A0A090LNV0_STRRB|nr:F-box domain-containing protein [Strongyloides ratti]CEF71446.1 F-box domain-containing protein [Strongyloides ratti]